jgi:ATP-binding cassette subfamily B protein
MTNNIDLLTNKLRGTLTWLPYLPQALTLVWAAARGWTLVWVVLLIVQGLLPAAIVNLTRLLVDSLVAVIEAGGTWETIRPTIVLAALMGGLQLMTQILTSVTVWIRTAQSELVKDYVISLVHEQSIALDLSFYDSADYYDHLHRARIEASFRPVSLLENLGGLLQNGITLVAMAAVLIPYGVWLPLALLASTLPAFYLVLRHNLREHDWQRRVTADERRAWYYSWLLTAREAAAEVRLFGLGRTFRPRYQVLRQHLREQRLALAKSQALARLGATVAALLVTAATLVWMGWQALQGLYTLGDLALFYQAFNRGQAVMRSLFDAAGQIHSNSLFLGNLFEFLALEPQVVDPPRPHSAPSTLQKGIHFQCITFRYPGSERAALKDLNLIIPAGQIMAIVGPNGAGKSTLIKLLCRFYDPESGQIELDGINLRDLPMEELRRLITVLFQEPMRYQATASENITLGDLLAQPDAAEIVAAAEAAGADEPIAQLAQGYDTLLGTWFEGGTDLSVGEWQRIALARAFLRQAPIIVLDEPTSAMDSWAEADWLGRFRRLAAGRTALIITHRFTTAMHADVIHVMQDGQIVESGSHEELLILGGRYAQSWTAQMRSAL